ncbi:hypothetical protein LSH36_342g00026 [Paralvinella palmiformis]|uniref:RING-type domain-containing protein n=1 Tax=Paralvinella palmiformis TaxID=53620 RepID=A0AAD9JF23_9ANNE|nr:hypothetical protein LSH36_342g00026 [Paralvinella palmiformis]
MKIIISFSIYTDNKIMSVYNMSASFNDTQKLRAGEDEVFSTVTAEVNARLRLRLTNYEDVLGEVEEQTGVEIKFSRKKYYFVGSWSQLVEAKELLERYTENNTPLNDSSDPKKFESFLVVDKAEKTEKKLQNSQKDGIGMNIRARDETPSRQYEDSGPNAEEVEDSYEKKTTLQRSSPGLEDAVERDRSSAVNVRDGHTESVGTASNQQVEEEDEVQNEKRSEYIPKVSKEQHEQPAEVEAQDQLEMISSEPLMVDENVFEYMKYIKLVTELKDQFSMDLVMQNIDGDAFVMILTPEGKTFKQEQMILARAAFIEAYQNTLTVCTREVCKISGNIPSAYREEIFADTLLSYPDIMIRELPNKTNSYIFVGPAQKVKSCRHFFITCADKLTSKVGCQFQSTRMAADINLERSNKLQCMEAKMIEGQAMIASAINGGQSAMQRADPGHAEPPQQEDAVTDHYGDMPDLEEMIEEDERQSLKKAQDPQDEVEEKKDHVPAKTKGVTIPIVELFTSSSSDDDDDGVGAGDKQPKADDDLKDQRIKPNADRAVDCKKDSHLYSSKCLDFPKDWYLSLSEACTCEQCAEETKEVIRLGCKHEFCLTCVKNPSRMPGFCPQCGIHFDREQFRELEKKLLQTLRAKTEQRKHEPNKVPTASGSQSSEKQQFRPELQGDGTFIKASTDKLCEQCAELYQWLVLLKCSHELCNIAYPSTRFETYLPNSVDGRSLFRLILEANKEKKMFELLPTDKGRGIIYPVDGLSLRKDQETIDTEYLAGLECTLRKHLKEQEKV